MPVSLQYSVTRSFKWPWFGPLSLLGGLIVFAFLVVINISLTGYETVVTFQDSFNATDSHWFYRLMPFRRPKPGTLCDPHVFRIGDTFTTNYSYFQWTVDTITIPNAGSSAVSYKGTPLDTCDLAGVYLNGDLGSWTLDYTIVIACQQGKDFAITAKTSFSVSWLPGHYSEILGLTRYLNEGTDGSVDVRGKILDNLIETASQDLGSRAYDAFVGSNFTTPTILSLRANFKYCPLSSGLDANCSVSPPVFLVTAAAVVYANATVRSYSSDANVSNNNPWVLDADTEAPVHNIIETIYAAIRIDLGNPSPNNFIVNRSFLNETIYSTFPATKYNADATTRMSMLYAIWNNPDDQTRPFLPVTVGGPAEIQLVYAFATLSMFSSGWAVYILVATKIALQQDASANKCDGHCHRHQRSTEPSWFDAYDAYGISQTDHPSTKHHYRPVQS
ncbi:hypothetical protein CVT26_013372 [Gymnopilus dilepis]|uniref:Transmembrane protein n=1 Tax=Gymnopilus dilepis TaxID=231916 RepID=A0A409VUW9_9AGAR|nr:hypothetical protein CVT26_013372 [Gymnopilus dilepis]